MCRNENSDAPRAPVLKNDPCAPILKKEGVDIQLDAETSKFRLVYLAINIAINLVMLGQGITAYTNTHSLSVMIDWLGGSVTLVALIVSIVVETMKMRVQSNRTVLILDLVGCLLNVVLLVGVTVFGIVDALYRTTKAQEEQVSNLDRVILFGACSFSADIITLLVYWGLKKFMLGDSGEKKTDELNVLSSLLHLFTDLGGSIIILVTALFLKYGDFQGESWAQAIAHKVLIDSSGAIVMCICLIVAIVMFQKDAFKSIEMIRAFDDEHIEHKTVDYGTLPCIPEVSEV